MRMFARVGYGGFHAGDGEREAPNLPVKGPDSGIFVPGRLFSCRTTTKTGDCVFLSGNPDPYGSLFFNFTENF